MVHLRLSHWIVIFRDVHVLYRRLVNCNLFSRLGEMTDEGIYLSDSCCKPLFYTVDGIIYFGPDECMYLASSTEVLHTRCGALYFFFYAGLMTRQI